MLQLGSNGGLTTGALITLRGGTAKLVAIAGRAWRGV